jgi:hypothetical protein
MRKSLILVFLFLSVIFFVFHNFDEESQVSVIPLDDVFDVISSDINRIEVFYPKQFERLEMDWEQNVSDYREKFHQTSSSKGKLEVLSRFTNSWHNAHHGALQVYGWENFKPQEKISLPLRFIDEGLKLSEAQFFVLQKSKDINPELDINVGDEVLEYNGQSISELVLQMRDEDNSESPEAVLDFIASRMGYQGYCTWTTQVRWEAGDDVEIVLKDKITQKKKHVVLKWKKKGQYSFRGTHVAPFFSDENQNWEFKTIFGEYSFENPWEGYDGFFGVLSNDTQKFLILKQYYFHSYELIHEFVKEAHTGSYDGVILDYHENGGGNDSYFALLTGLLGDGYHVELSSLKLIPELLSQHALFESAVYSSNVSYFRKILSEPSTWNKMSPFVPFQCLDENCEPQTAYRNYKDDYKPQPKIIADEPMTNLALITGHGTVSKADSVSVLFRAHDIGPVVGTPNMASSGRYYFKKEYLVDVEGKVITLRATFTPDFSIDGNCEEVQANPVKPHVLLPETLENHDFYDTELWVTAARAIQTWNKPMHLDRKCTFEEAEEKLKSFGLEMVK